MVTKEYLAETRETVAYLRQMSEDIMLLKENAVSTPSQLFSDTRVQTTRKTDAMAGKVAAYTELEELYTRTYNWYLDRHGIISEAIRPLPFREQLLVIRYYLKGENMLDICDALQVSKATFYRLLRSALAHIADACS